MEIPTQQNHVYTLTCDNACEVYDVDTDRLIHVHHAGEVQSQFTAIGMKSRTSDDTAHITELFNCAPAGNGGGGYIESNLNVGHGASSAVAAQCTLTPGDLTQGGTLTHGSATIELNPPDETAAGSTKAEGWVPVADATAAGSVTFGEHEPVVFEADAGEPATGTFSVMEDSGTISVTNGEEEYSVQVPDDPDSVAGWNQSFTEAGCGIVCTATDAHGEIEVSVEAAEGGEAGNSIEISVPGYEPVALSGGTDGTRTAADIAAVLEALDYISEVQVDADEGGIALTAAHAGVNDLIRVEGDLFGSVSPPIGMAGGVLSYTLAEIVSAIEEDAALMDIASASVSEGKIVLTAPTTPTAAEYNGFAYTATGCFGSGTVKQGSTTRGKNAVEQTAFKIYLNGAELDVEPAPLPTALTPTTAMKNGGVYTVEAAYEATTLSLPANATAEIWVRIGATAFNVSLPDTWMWVNGAASDMTGKTNTTFCIAVRNDGVRVLASMQYSYDTTPAQS